MGIIENAWDKTNRRQDEELLIAALSDFSLRSTIRPHLYELDAADFFNPVFGKIWLVARELADENRIITLAPFKARLSPDEYQALISYQDVGARLVEVERGIEYVRDAAKRRRFIEVLKESSIKAGLSEDYSQVLGATHSLLAELDTGEVTANSSSAAELADQFWDEYENPQEKPKPIETPWAAFNQALGTKGLAKNRLTVVAAKSGHGKSLAMLNIATKAALDGYKVAVFSMEMSRMEVFERMVASVSNQSSSHIERRKLSQDAHDPEYWASADYGQVKTATDKLSPTHLEVWDEGDMTIDWIRAQCTAMQRMVGLDLVVVDYLQILSMRGYQNREQAVSDSARLLKVLAKSLGVAVVTGSQMNKNEKDSTHPTLDSLRESDGIGNNSDVVFFVVHDLIDGRPNGDARFVFAKQRNGGLPDVPVLFDGAKARFLSADMTFIED